MRVNRANLSRKIFSLKDFRGVDYASSPLEVQPYRATDMANLLLRNGMLRKRYGFRQVYNLGIRLDLTPLLEDSEIKVFQTPLQHNFVVQVIQGEEGDKESEFVVLHNNNGTFEMGGQYLDLPLVTKIGSSVYIDGYMYIFCGDLYRFEDEEGIIEKVNDYYIPTTTINIPLLTCINIGTDNEPKAVFEADGGIAYPYTSNESVNLLTNKVRNELMIKGDLSKYTDPWFYKFRYFQLDGKIAEIILTEEGVADQTSPVIEGTYGSHFSPILAKELFFQNGVQDEDFDEQLETRYCWYNEYLGVAICADRKMVFESRVVNYKVEEKNSIVVIVDETKFQTWLNTSGTESVGAADKAEQYKKISIVYENVNLGLTERSITSCTCVATYGVDGANDRLFVSGGYEGNMVYISENGMNYKPNPTYFPADSFLVCGTDDSPVNGFMRVTDGRLAIIKDVSNAEDVSVYYASGGYVDVGLGEEGNAYKQARFAVQAGDISRKGISARSIVNLEGDNIFVAEEGVFGIQLSSNIASGERYARERSRTVNPKITKLGLKNSRGIVFKDKYYLAVDNGEVYVADARYRFALEGDQQDTFNYEWFRLTDLFVKAWFTIGNKLYFIDKYGYICEVTEGFSDCYMVSTEHGELTVNDDGTVTFDEERLDLIKSAEYAVDDDGDVWRIELTKDGDGNDAIKVPSGIEIEDADKLTLWFHVPINAYWQSAVLDLENPMIRKNMWSLSATVGAEHGGMINLGYKTRMKHVNDIELQGANENTFDDNISLFGAGTNGFGMHTFDTGGFVGINTYRRRVFERNFIFLQLLFESDTVNDCVINEIDVEYAIARKNIGVG